MNELTFVDVVGSFGSNGNEVRVDVFVEHRTVDQHSSLRVYLLDGIFSCDLRDFLLVINSAKTQRPNWQARCFLQSNGKAEKSSSGRVGRGGTKKLTFLST